MQSHSHRQREIHACASRHVRLQLQRVLLFDRIAGDAQESLSCWSQSLRRHHQ